MKTHEFDSVNGERLRVRRSKGNLVLEHEGLGPGDWREASPGRYVPSLLAELFGQDAKPIDERISDAFERLLALAKEDEDLDLVAVVGVIRALWMSDAVPLAGQARAGGREIVEGEGHADRE